MEYISQNTKRGQAYLRAYEYAKKNVLKHRDIYCFYDNPSGTKVLAWWKIKEEARKLDTAPIILGGSCFSFSACYKVKNTLVVFTKDNVYYVAPNKDAYEEVDNLLKEKGVFKYRG